MRLIENFFNWFLQNFAPLLTLSLSLLQLCPPSATQSQPNLLEPAPMGNAHGQNRAAGSGSSPQATGGSLLRLAAGGRHGAGCMPPLAALEDRRSSSNSSHQQARVFSRFVKQKRDVFLQATPPVSPASLPASPLTDWTPPDVGHGQLNASAEQMDFRKSISKFTNNICSDFFSVFVFVFAFDCYYSTPSSFLLLLLFLFFSVDAQIQFVRKFYFNFSFIFWLTISIANPVLFLCWLAYNSLPLSYATV